MKRYIVAMLVIILIAAIPITNKLKSSNNDRSSDRVAAVHSNEAAENTETDSSTIITEPSENNLSSTTSEREIKGSDEVKERAIKYVQLSIWNWEMNIWTRS